MCIAFALHYNILEDYPLCRSELDNAKYMMRYLAGTTNVTWSNELLEYVALSPAHVAGMTISEISDSRFVNWDTGLRSRLKRDHKVEPHISVCPSLIELMKGLILGIRSPTEYVNLPINVDENEPEQTCGLSGR